MTKTLHVSNTGTKYRRTKIIISIQITVLQNSRLHVIWMIFFPIFSCSLQLFDKGNLWSVQCLTIILKYKKLFFPFLSHLWDQISTMLSSPHKYPSSWLPSCQGDLWSSSKPSLRATVFPKSIIHTLALPLVSWTNNRELPMTCNLKQSKII